MTSSCPWFGGGYLGLAEGFVEKGQRSLGTERKGEVGTCNFGNHCIVNTNRKEPSSS